MYIIQRHLSTLRRVLIPGKTVIIYGARRTGKTTLLKQFLQDSVELYKNLFTVKTHDHIVCRQRN